MIWLSQIQTGDLLLCHFCTTPRVSYLRPYLCGSGREEHFPTISRGGECFSSCEVLGHYKLWEPYRNYTPLQANLEAPGSCAEVAMSVHGNAALSWHCCLWRPDVRADPQIKGSKEKKMEDALCLFVSSGMGSPTYLTEFVHSTWAHTAARRGDYGVEAKLLPC